MGLLACEKKIYDKGQRKVRPNGKYVWMFHKEIHDFVCLKDKINKGEGKQNRAKKEEIGIGLSANSGQVSLSH